jgi:hypothetical protein
MRPLILIIGLVALQGCVQATHPELKASTSPSADHLHELLAKSANEPCFKMDVNLPDPPDQGISDLELDRLRGNLANIRFPARDGTVERLFEHKLVVTTRIDGDTFTNPGGDLGGTILEYELNDKLVLRVNHETYEFAGRDVTIEGFADIVAKSDSK